MPAIVRGGGRQSTFDDFCVAIKNPKPGVVPILLVDAEAPVATGHNVWQHLATRDRWNRPQNAADDSAFLMVQMMEHWFVADPAALERYFGQGFKRSAMKQWPNLEAVPKVTVIDALAQATNECSKQYAKGKPSFEILAILDHTAVTSACPAAARFLARLRG